MCKKYVKKYRGASVLADKIAGLLSFGAFVRAPPTTTTCPRCSYSNPSLVYDQSPFEINTYFFNISMIHSTRIFVSSLRAPRQ